MAYDRGDQFSHLSGMLTDVGMINDRLVEAAEVCNIVTPSMTCSALTPGCVVGFDVVRLGPRESYDVGGKKALHRVALLRLASAAGFSLNPRASRRTDDKRHPYLVQWHEEGGWMDLHGTVQLVPGDYNLDLRDGSAQSEEVLSDAKGANDQEREAKGRMNLMSRRSNILELAQSGAQDKAIRTALAIPSYSYEEIRRPFVVVRLSYLGHDDNPVLAAENKRAIRAKMLGGISSLFGDPPAALAPTSAPLPALPPAAIDMVAEPPPAPEPPPPCCEFCGADGDDVRTAQAPKGPILHCSKDACVGLAHANLRREQAEELAATQPPKTPAPEKAPAYPRASASSPAARAGVAPPPIDAPGTTPRGGTRGRRGGGGVACESGHFIPPGDGPFAGMPIEAADDNCLAGWEQRLRRRLEGGKTPQKFIAADTKLLAAIRVELDRREAENPLPY